MLVILMTSLLEEQLEAVTVVQRVKQVEEKAVGERRKEYNVLHDDQNCDENVKICTN